MALYEHKSEGGKGDVDERVRTVPDSYNDKTLAEKAADNASGWSLVREDQDAPRVTTVGQAPVGEQAPTAPPAGDPGKAAKGGEQK